MVEHHITKEHATHGGSFHVDNWPDTMDEWIKFYGSESRVLSVLNGATEITARGAFVGKQTAKNDPLTNAKAIEAMAGWTPGSGRQKLTAAEKASRGIKAMRESGMSTEDILALLEDDD